MRVALLAQHCPARDAIGRQTLAKLSFFLDNGAEVRLFVESAQGLPGAVRRHCQVVVPRQPPSAVWDYLTSADLVMAEYGHAYDILNWLPLLAGGQGRVVLDYHGVTPAELWNGPNQESAQDSARQRGVIWCCDAAMVHSHYAQDELLKATDFPASLVHILDYPVEPVFFVPRASPPTWRQRLGLGQASVLLFVGRVAANKRLPILVAALEQLKEFSPPVHAVVIGDNTGVYAAEAEQCRQLAADLGVAGRLHFLGQVEEDCLVEAYRSADLLVIPSSHEGYCLPVLEAMACGLSVLAAQAGALPETVGDAGLTFQPDDAADLARQARRILAASDNHSHQRGQMQQLGRERAWARQPSAWRQRFGQLVEQLLDGPHLPRHDQVQLQLQPPGSNLAGKTTHLLKVRLTNTGNLPLLPRGPGRTRLCGQVRPGGRIVEVPLPGLVMPGQTATVSMPLPLPQQPGNYQAACWAERPLLRDTRLSFQPVPEPASVPLTVRCQGEAPDAAAEAPHEEIQEALIQAHRARELPEDYVDLSTGWLGAWKQWLKHKLLHNFKRGYVDVLSRQQSEFNRHLLTVVQELADHCSALHQTVQQLEGRLARLEKESAREQAAS